MPLYVCSKCKAVENTALGHFWASNMRKRYKDGGPPLCSECHSGKWHDKFPKEIATTQVIKEIGEYHFVHTGDIPDVCPKNPCAIMP